MKVLPSEPLKIVFDAYEMGYLGGELYSHFRVNKIEPEFYDEHYVVLMISPSNTDEDFERLENTVANMIYDVPFEKRLPTLTLPKQVMSIRDAVLAESERVKTENAVGRICAAPTVSCPPAIPIAISGEEITAEPANLLKYYKINEITVVK